MSANGTAFTQTNSGAFTAGSNHHLTTLTPAAARPNIRYVRFTMLGTQSSAGTGADWMDMSELKVYGVSAGRHDQAASEAARGAATWRVDARRGHRGRVASGAPGLGARTDNTSAAGTCSIGSSSDRRRRVHKRHRLPRGAHADLQLAPGHDYRFRVQARDEAGNASPPATGPAFSTAVRQENAASLTYGAGWLARAARATAYGGFLRPTATANASVNSRFSGRAVGVVMPRAGNLGSAQICLTDLTAGTAAACRTIDLSPATGTGVRKLVYEEHGLDPSHTYRVAVRTPRAGSSSTRWRCCSSRGSGGQKGGDLLGAALGGAPRSRSARRPRARRASSPGISRANRSRAGDRGELVVVAPEQERRHAELRRACPARARASRSPSSGRSRASRAARDRPQTVPSRRRCPRR